MAKKKAAIRYVAIAGFPGYVVGDDGLVWSCRRPGPGNGMSDAWKKLDGGTDKDGYKKVILCRSGERAYKRVHILVLEAFVGPCPAGQEARHVNGNHADNRATNLCWGTHVENIMDNFRNGVRGPTVSVETVKLIRSDLAEGVPVRDVAAKHRTTRGVVYGIKAGKTWRHVAAV